MALNSLTPFSINALHVSSYPSTSKISNTLHFHSKSSQIICKMNLNKVSTI